MRGHKYFKGLLSIILVCAVVLSVAFSHGVTYALDKTEDVNTTEAVTEDVELPDDIYLVDGGQQTNIGVYGGTLQTFVGVNTGAQSEGLDTEAILAQELQDAAMTDQNSGIALASTGGFLTRDEVVTQIRAHLVARDTAFTVKYAYTDTWSISAAYNMAINLINDAMAETGNPKEGSYIRGQFYTYACTLSYSKSGSTYNYTIYIHDIVYYSNAEQEAMADERVAEILDEIIEPCMSDYEKVRAIWLWFRNNVRYADDLRITSYSAYRAFCEGQAVCNGYATAFYRLLLEEGIDCRYVAGDMHAWNIVKLGDVWYNADPTWIYDSWFLKCDANFPNHNPYSGYTWDELPRATQDFDTTDTSDAANQPNHDYEMTDFYKSGCILYEDYTCAGCGDTYTEASGSHTLTHVSGTTANIEYWYCSVCGKYFADEDAENEITEDDTKIGEAAHPDVTYHPAVAATCLTDGNIAYWYCADCDSYFSDSDLLNEVSPSDVTIAKLGHNLTLSYPGYAASCTTDGRYDCWACTRCRLYFTSNTDKYATNGSSTRPVIPATNHKGTLIYVVPQAATATEDGNIGYYYCTLCGKYGTDESMTDEITLVDTVLPAGSIMDVTIQVNWLDATGNPTTIGLPDSLTFKILASNDSHSHMECADGVQITADGGWTVTVSGIPGGYDTYTVMTDDETYILEPSYDADTQTITVNATINYDVIFSWDTDSLTCEAEMMDTFGNVIKTGTCDVALSEIVTEATCTEDGIVAYMASFTVDGRTYTDTVEIITEATGHSWGEGVVTTEATTHSQGILTYTCTVCGETYTESTPSLGSFVTETTGEIEGSTFVAEDAHELLTEEEQVLLQEGGTVDVFLDVEPKADVSEDEKDLIMDAIKKDKEGTVDNTSIYYLEIDLNKQVRSADGTLKYETPMTDILGTRLELTIPVPGELLEKADGKSGAYYVVRIHDKKADILQTKYNKDSQTVVFVTDRFSTYAIVFQEDAVGDGEADDGQAESGTEDGNMPDEGKNSSEDGQMTSGTEEDGALTVNPDDGTDGGDTAASDADSGTYSVTAAKTGDSGSIVLWIFAALCGACIVTGTLIELGKTRERGF